MRKRFSYYSLPILSGFLIGTSYIPFPPWALLFCLIPLWNFWNKESSYKRIFIGGWITQFVLNAIGFHWIAYTTVQYGQMPWPIGVAVLLLFCILAHLYYPIAGVLWLFLRKKFNLSQTTAILILPFVFILCERLYPFLFYWHFGYPWLWARLPGYQLAEWVGFFGLNLITLIINSLFLLFWIERRKGQWLQKYGIAALLLFIVTNGAGYLVSKNLTPTEKHLKVLVVQGNIGNLDKIYAEKGNQYMEHTVNVYMRLTRQAINESDGTIDLIVWPETAFPATIHSGLRGYQHSKLVRLSREHGIPILTGVYQRTSKSPKIHNGLMLIKDGEIVDSYQKTHLLAFGEYLPFAEWFPQLKKMLPMISDFGRGNGPSVIAMDQLQIGAQICYEGLFDEFSTDLQSKQANIFVNVTNDSWFGYPFEPYQHMYMTLARAVENRRPLIRSTNTGITTVILASGQVLEQSPHGVEWYKVYDIPYQERPSPTFYANLSKNWPWILSLIIGLLILGDKLARTRKH